MEGFMALMGEARSEEQAGRALERHASGLRGKRNHGLSGVYWLLGVGLMWAGAASGMTAEGALLTNIACATYSSSSQVGFSVSYCSTVPVLVRNPHVCVGKSVTPTMEAPLGTVTYTICVVNDSMQSATAVTLKDRIPDNMAFLDLSLIHI